MISKLKNVLFQRISEQFLRESDEDDNIQKILNLLWSANESNIDLAEYLSKHVDQGELQREFSEKFEGVLALAYHTPRPHDTIFDTIKKIIKTVRAVNLNERSIKKHKDSLSFFKYVEALFINKTQIETIPDAVKVLENIDWMDLSKNNITIMPNWINNFKNIRTLSLENNKLEDFPNIFGLNNIKYLNLSNNNISIIFDEVNKLTNLEYLSLDNNPIQIIDNSLDNLPNLKQLAITNNKIIDKDIQRLISIYGNNKIIVKN